MFSKSNPVVWTCLDMVSLHSRYEKMIDHEEWQYSHLALYKQSWTYALFIFYVRAVGKSWFRNRFWHGMLGRQRGMILNIGSSSKMRQDTKTRTLQSGDARNVALNFCDLRRSRSFDLWFYGIHFDLTNSWPRTNNGQVMLTSEFSPCRSYRKIEVLYGFVLACFGPNNDPQPLPSQLFLAQTSKRRHSAMQRQGSFAERHFCSDMPSLQIKRCPADMETRVNIAATWACHWRH